MTYYVLITADIPIEIDGTTVYLKSNETYPLVEAYREVLEDGLIVEYNAATIEETTVNVPLDYSAVIPETEIPVHKTMIEKFLDERSDTTTDYHTAYQDRLGITINHLPDVDKDSWIDPRTETREDPDE